MRTHDWTEIDWTQEFSLLAKDLQVDGCGDLEQGDEVIIRLKVSDLDRHWEGDCFVARLKPAEVRPVHSIWQQLINFLKRSA